MMQHQKTFSPSANLPMLSVTFPFIEIRQTVEAPSYEVWNVMTDTSLWPCWGPSIRRVECADRPIKAGSTGRVQLISGLWIKFVVTNLVEGRYWSWHILGVRATGHRVEPINTTRCLAIFEIPIFAAPYIIVCKVALDRIRKLAGSTSPSRVSRSVS